MNDKIILTYEQVHSMSLELAEKAAALKPNLIVGLSRGGLLPAIIVSHKLDLPMVPISYSSRMGKSDNQTHMNFLQNLPCTYLPVIKNSTICIVDDILDSGNTMKEVTSHFMNPEFNNVVFSMSLVSKGTYDHNSHFSAVWLPAVSGWVIFPFENQAVI